MSQGPGKQVRDQMRRQTKQHEADRRAWHKERIRLQTLTHTGINHLVDAFPELPDLFQILTEIDEAAQPGQGQKTDTTRSKSHDYLSPSGHTLKEGSATYRARGTKGQAVKQLAGLVKRLENMADPNRIEEPRRPQCGRRSCSGRWKRQPFGVVVCGFCGELMKGKA